MCSEVMVRHPDGNTQYCDTVADLSAALGIPAASVSDDPPAFCLCNAHWDALCATMATVDEGYPWPTYIIDRRVVA